ncbi:hypothetical protein [Rhizobium sp. ICMP 5592]|uniref:hypothetical protein n=1 Tax=Rhizobium sp. ICMP 5592 TaxID=2292445 RepID=UPI001296D339|nr:hypothetical protein [Rhizobium sp. ICMP 5592]MQB40702.1 hypothetical protein [Rhizobium sp. ICMP 5592]
MYWYISILPPSGWNTLSDRERLIAFLREQSDLKQINAMSFGAADGRPWVDIAILKANSPDSWSSDGIFSAHFNRVEMVCSDTEPQHWYEELAVRIAEFLQWDTVEEDEPRQIHGNSK